MNRRGLLKGVVGLTTGLLLPSTVGENAETARRYWALDRTMMHQNSLPSFADLIRDWDWSKLGPTELLWAYDVSIRRHEAGEPHDLWVDCLEDVTVFDTASRTSRVLMGKGDQLTFDFSGGHGTTPLIAWHKPAQDETRGTYLRCVNDGEVPEFDTFMRQVLTT